jgi:hypothetical protein
VKEMPVPPFRVFSIAARPPPLPAEVVLFWNWSLVQSMTPAEVSPLLVLRSRFAVSASPRLCGFPSTGCRRRRLSDRPRPLVELYLPLEFYPATPTRPPRRPSPLMGFRSLQHLRNPRSTLHEPKPARYVPPSGFGYPLDGLLPRIPCRFSFTPAALLGFTLRRFLLPRGFQAFQSGRTHLPLPQWCFRRRSVESAHRGSVSGFTPLGMALQSHGVLIRRPPGASLGFCPSRVPCEDLGPDFSGPPLTCLARPRDYSRSQPAPQSFDRPSPRLARPVPEYPPAEATLNGVSAPARS